MSRTKSFFYNSLTAGVYQVILMIAGFITPHVMLKYYGSEINGLVSSVNQFIVYFNLVEAGLSGAAIHALYKPLADSDHKAINGIVAAAKKFYTQSGYIFISLTIGLAVIYPALINSKGIQPLSVTMLVLILGVNGALEFFTLAKYRVLLAADQKTYVVSMASIIHIIANTFIVVILSSRRVDIVFLRFVALLSIFLRSLILMIYIKFKYKFVNYKETPNIKALSKRWDALYLQVLGAVQSGSPIVILTLIVKDLKVVSVYTIFNMIGAAINGVLSIFINGISALFGDVIAKGEKNTLKKAYGEFEFFYYSLITVVYSVAFITIMPFIKIYTSGIKDISYDLPMVGFLFVLNGVLYNIKIPQGMLVQSAGLFKETRVQTTIQALIALVAGIILTPFLGIIGVLLSSIFSNIYRDIDLIVYISRTVTKTPVRNTVKRINRLVLCIIFTYVSALPINISPTSYFGWAVYSSIIGIYVSLIVLVSGYFFERNIFTNIMKRIRGMVK